MLNKTITLEQVLSLKPCYSKRKLLAISEGKTEMTIGEIIELQHVPAEHKIWLLVREEYIPERTLHEFALWCAETALNRAKVTDERSWNALKVKRLWLDGKATDEEFDAARAAAYEAASAPTLTAASASARVAAMDAALASASVSAWASALAAASAAARVAARHATRASALEADRRDAWATAKKDQLAKLKEMLEGQAHVKQVNHH